MAKQFKTIEEMEKFYYADPLTVIAENNGISVDELVSKAKQEAEYINSFTSEEFAKAAPVITSTTGALNYIYGAGLWSSVCNEANAFGLLPKKPYQHGGYRAVTAAGATTTAGTTESGAVPASVKPTMAAVDVGLKTLAAAIEISEVMSLQEGKDDVVTWGELVNYARDEFVNRINRGLLTDANTLASTNIESIDRAIGSYSEAAGSGYTTSDHDIYGLDRDAGATWTDSYVSHGSTTDRTFALSLLDTVLDGVAPYWKNRKNKVILTGYDTARRIQQLENPKATYTPDMSVEFSVNGVQTKKGIEAGIPVASYDGIPIITSNNVPKDTISRIFIIDLDHMWIGVGRPVTYVESSDPLVVGFQKRGAFSMVGELVCTNFAAQGKVRDLK